MLATLATSSYLGPARVTQVTERRVRLRLQDQELWATVALAFPYELALEDRVLVIGQDDQWYVIGLLEGRGTTKLIVPGDLELRAPRGAIRLSAGKRIEVAGPLVAIKAGRLRLMAHSVRERFARATRWVRETASVQAERLLTKVNGDYRLHAGRIKEKARGRVQIDGEKIDLG
jgi:hypothetical protein